MVPAIVEKVREGRVRGPVEKVREGRVGGPGSWACSLLEAVHTRTQHTRGEEVWVASRTGGGGGVTGRTGLGLQRILNKDAYLLPHSPSKSNKEVMERASSESQREQRLDSRAVGWIGPICFLCAQLTNKCGLQHFK